MVLDWKKPDFIDLNFGCPVNKVVCKNGGSALLRNCPLLEQVASTVVRAVAPHPVTAKIRIGWDHQSINATETARILEACGIQAIAVHGRTKEQGYGGVADWEVISQVAHAVNIPVIGNGDIASPEDVKKRLTSGVAGIMVGRAAMSAPWIFHRTRVLLSTGILPPEPTLVDKWAHIFRHCRDMVARIGREELAMQFMRSRLMAYSRGFPDAKTLRQRFAEISSLVQMEDLIADHLARNADNADEISGVC
jgi:nifR3 family TIM-barrel protein